MMRWLVLTALLMASSPTVAETVGKVVKVGLLIGNNRGAAGEVQLLYAHDDARKLAAVLSHHGGFRAEDLTVVLEGDAAEVRSALITINDRIRRLVQDGQREVVLFVYYSGHADSEALHLGDSQLPVAQLRKLVSGSAARFRVLVLDSCKSGNLTRVKGGRPVAPFQIDIRDELAGEGTVVITSSAFDEDAQESDRYRGSLFTHHFTSGLLGAADLTGDGQVSLTEVYRYAYEQTIKSTSRTWAGTQHPTYQYEIKGKGDIVLTRLSLDRQDEASLIFERPGAFLLLRDDEDGPVAAEIVADGPGRRLVLEPGTYFIRERRRDELREGTIELKPGRRHHISDWNFERIAYARLVRKGAGVRTLAHGPMIGYRFRGEILSGMGWMHLATLAYPLHLPWLTIEPRLSAGRSTTGNFAVSSATTEVDLVVSATYSFDLSWLTLAAGLELGGAYLGQRFVTDGAAPDRDQFSFLFGGIASASIALHRWVHMQVTAEALSYLLFRQNAQGDRVRETPLTYVVGLSLGTVF